MLLIKNKDKNGYEYTEVENDPNKVRQYTLKNGLQVFLAKNDDAPKIQTFIAVKTGSNNDPADSTGLSHYLEHMLFKGSTKIGTANWMEEKKILDQISDLYELHKFENDDSKKSEIYKKIDSLSQKASKFAVANDYDKIISAIGGTGTNAHTWLDETVYKNIIPKNQLENWLKVEQERFSQVILRLFHTELETVYEEFNRAQDNDSRLANYALMELLFPTHPNGQQTTLGKAEHLRNPSMKNIYEYFDQFYVPNNYAMVLVGDLNFEKTIALVDEYFGKFQPKNLPEKKEIIEKPLKKSSKTVKSPSVPRVQIAWRTESYGSRESMLAELTANILSNKGECGLIDLNINQKQTALFAQAFSVGFKNYGYFSAVIVPKEGDSLDDGIHLILEEIEKIKKGDFPDWLIPAIVNDFKLQRIKTFQTSEGLASTIYDTYIKGRSWLQEMTEIPEYESITKNEIVDFAKNFFTDDFVTVYKEQGENENLLRVEQPPITPINLNRDSESDFFKEITAQKVPAIEPEFVDYKSEISAEIIKGKKINRVKNRDNGLAQLYLVYTFGSDNDQDMWLAVQYLQYLGTPEFSAEALRQEFYKIGITTDFKIFQNQFRISITGLRENLEAGYKLLIDWMQNAIPDQEVYDKFAQTILEARNANKKDKTKILGALGNYIKFGKFSRHTDVISDEDLQKFNPEILTEKISSWLYMPYEILFIGDDYEGIKPVIERNIFTEKFSYPTAKPYPEAETLGKTYLVDYDMVQVEMLRSARAEIVETKNFGKAQVLNNYFGRGLSSIVFQEIRESKSLAYSAYVSYATADISGRHNYISTYIGTQPDKLSLAVETFDNLAEKLPELPVQFENAKISSLSSIETARIKGANIYFNYITLQNLGYDYDIRKDIYNEIKDLKLEGLVNFYNNSVKKFPFNTGFLGDINSIKSSEIKDLQNAEILSLEEIFGF